MLISIKDTKTGEVRDCDLGADYDETFDAYDWEDGNYACDCNRAQLFAAADGDYDANFNDFPCGTGRFIVVAAIRDGELVYTEEN